MKLNSLRIFLFFILVISLFFSPSYDLIEEKTTKISIHDNKVVLNETIKIEEFSPPIHVIINNKEKPIDSMTSNTLLDLDFKDRTYKLLISSPFQTEYIRFNEVKNSTKAGKANLKELPTIAKSRKDHKVVNNHDYNYKLYIERKQANIIYTEKEIYEKDNFFLIHDKNSSLKEVNQFIDNSFPYFYGEKVNVKPTVIIADKNSNLSEKFDFNREILGYYDNNLAVVNNIKKTNRNAIIIHELGHHWNNKLINVDIPTWFNEGTAEHLKNVYSKTRRFNSIKSYEDCINTSICYSKDNDISEEKLKRLYDQSERPKEKVWNNYQGLFSYRFSEAVVRKELQLRNNYTISEKISSLNSGKNISDIFQVKLCKDNKVYLGNC